MAKQSTDVGAAVIQLDRAPEIAGGRIKVATASLLRLNLLRQIIQQIKHAYGPDRTTNILVYRYIVKPI